MEPPPEAAALLATGLESADPPLLTITAWALGRLNDAHGPTVVPALLTALRRTHWLQIEHSELPGQEFVSIRPVFRDALRGHLPASADPDPEYEDFRLLFFMHVFHPARDDIKDWVAEIVSHRWYLKLQRRRFGHPAGTAARAAVREMVLEAWAKFTERILENPTLGVTPADYAHLPGFIKNHCRNIAWRIRERRKKDRAGRIDLDVSRAADTRAADDGMEVLDTLQTALPAEEREVARLVLLLDFTVAQAAAQLNLSHSQVKTRLKHARRRLADRLG